MYRLVSTFWEGIMIKAISDIAFSSKVKQMQERFGSRASYAKMDERGAFRNAITEDLVKFILHRDSFYFGTASKDGQPYIQHRGGPKGFLKVIDSRTLGFADFSGNRQYISYGNLEDNNKVCLFFMDYPNRARIKLWGTAEIKEDDASLIEQLTMPDYKAKVERAYIIHIKAWDRNCPQHIMPRYTKKEIGDLDICPSCEPANE